MVQRYVKNIINTAWKHDILNSFNTSKWDTYVRIVTFDPLWDNV